MKIKDLSISDLKVSYDFTLSDIKQYENAARKIGINPDQLNGYLEIRELAERLNNELINRIRILD